MSKEIQIYHEVGTTELRVSRGSDIEDIVWLKVQAEWGTTSPRPGQFIEVPVSQFLSRLDWVAPYCRPRRVRVVWQGGAKQLVIDRNRSGQELARTLGEPSPLPRQVVLEGLEQGRYLRQLRDFQLRDLLALLGMANGANFSVPGAGKTSVSYAVYEYLHQKEEVAQLLIVAPLSAFEAWREEMELCFQVQPELQAYGESLNSTAEIVLVNYQRLQSNYTFLAEWTASKNTHLILDEAHRMKRGWAGQWGRNCLNLANLARRRDILTGTPAPQSVYDLEALFDFVWPGQGRRIIPGDLPDEGGTEIVSQRIAPLYVRTTKTELDLQEPKIIEREQSLTPLHLEIYQAITGVFGQRYNISRTGRMDLRALGRVAMYLLEAATNPSLLVAGSHRHDPVQFRHPPLEIPSGSYLEDLLVAFPKHEFPWKFEFLKSTVKGNMEKGKKTLVWSNFVRNLETLWHYELADFNPAMIHGGVRDRQEELTRFRSDDNCHVLLANPAAVGEGISLHHVCHDAIYLERTFNAGQYLQSVDRIHRLDWNLL